MTIQRFRATCLAGAAALSILIATAPARAVIVFDPSNYAQNVMTAANTLRQINNRITSLQNQAQMLINQARNLASLPFSALQQLQQSVQRTQQLLQQAQKIAYDVRQIDQAFRTACAPATASASDQSLIAGAQQRWQTSRRLASTRGARSSNRSPA